MVIGNGMMATRFSDFRSDAETIIFASGVSNSKETDPAAFEREMRLLSDTLAGMRSTQRLVYFSTTSMYDPSVHDTAYIHHKEAMEDLIRNSGVRYLIFRVSNVVGPGSNPHTLFNFLSRAIASGAHFELWENSERNLIDVDDVYALVLKFMASGVERACINLAFPGNIPVPQVVAAISARMRKPARCRKVSKGQAFEIESLPLEVRNHFPETPEEYLEKLLNKYL